MPEEINPSQHEDPPPPGEEDDTPEVVAHSEDGEELPWCGIMSVN